MFLADMTDVATLPPFPPGQDPEPRSGLPHVGCGSRDHVPQGPLARDRGRAGMPELRRLERL